MPASTPLPNRGALAAFASYFLWGLFPIYWKWLHGVPSLQLLAHRMVWCFLFVAVALVWRGDHAWLAKIRQPRIFFTFVLAALLLSVNWLIYIWAVNAGYVVDASLGYFINPLVSVLLGILFLHERLRPGQIAAIVMVTLGVIYLAVSYGVVLWIALTLAGTFGLYGFLRKTAALDSIEGLSLETGIMFVPAVLFLLWQEGAGVGQFGHAGGTTTLLLILAGVVTAVPLLLFAYGAQRISLTSLGILQYVAPTMQLLIGVFVYGEAFPASRLLGFGLIWVALAVYTVEGRRHAFVTRRLNAARGVGTLS